MFMKLEKKQLCSKVFTDCQVLLFCNHLPCL